LLRDVSRSFYLTLRALPGRIRSQIGLAYLLARTTDTIADTELVPVGRRLEALKELSERIQGARQAPLDLGELSCQQGSPAERILLEQSQSAVDALGSLSPNDQKLVRAVLAVITIGQELDLRRFGGASSQHVLALQTDAELDDYTYRVAGCVGEFWTRMCRVHLFPKARLDDAKLLADAVRFGKGLQLVNVLRDLPADLGKGRCYLPVETLSACGLEPAELLQVSNEPRLRPGYNKWLERAASHLAAGWNYTNTLPRRCVRVRLACAWPLLIGADTLALLRMHPVLDSQRRLKVSRSHVKRILWRSVLYYPWSPAWRGLFPDNLLGGVNPAGTLGVPHNI
jgi:farnesyl-diphosphate farnesyltransferase